MFKDNEKTFRAQVTKQFIGLMVVIIIGVAAVIPVVVNITESAGLSGTTKTLVDLLPLLVGIALILVVVSVY